MDIETRAARMNIMGWIQAERRDYADKKYEPDGEMMHKLRLDMKNFGLDENGEWWVFITNYLKRAQLKGLDTEGGRQAFGKMIVTAINCLEVAIMEHGPMPQPGVPS